MAEWFKRRVFRGFVIEFVEIVLKISNSGLAKDSLLLHIRDRGLLKVGRDANWIFVE
jgi:hypothetical protein